MSFIGTCKLCKRTLQLIKQSHVIPNFMYKGLFGSKNEILLVQLSENLDKPLKQQTGIFEKHILCSDCDNRLIGKNEKYVSLILNGGTTKRPPNFQKRVTYQGLEIAHVSQIEYQKFKNFILSIVWRASISKHRFFEKAKVLEYEDILREILHEEKYVEESIFKISIIALLNQSNNLIRVIQNPEVYDINGGKCVIFYIGGFVYFVNLTKENSLPIFEISFLKEVGEISIPLLKGADALQFLTSNGLPSEIALKLFMQP
jgi:hypothetical protein